MRKIKVILTAMLLCLATVSLLAFGACGDDTPAITLDKDAVSVKVGETVTVVATLKDENATATWKSDDDKIATVSNGVITGVSKGENTVSAKVGEESASVKVTVTQAPDANLAKNGMLSFVALDGEITVEIYDGTTKVDTKKVTADFDVYSAIIDYRVKNSVADVKAYSVKVISGDFNKSFDTAKFYAIGDKAKFREAEALNDNVDRYFYLTADINYVQEDEATGGYGTGYKLFCSNANMDPNTYKPLNNNPHETIMNIDGRGHTLSATFVGTPGNGDRWMFDHIVDSNFKNLVIKYDFQIGYSSQATIANWIIDSDFDNCLFIVKLKLLSTDYTKAHLMSWKIEGSTFNDCIFNFIDNTEDKEKASSIGIYLQNEGVGGDKDPVYNNCALSYQYQDGSDSVFMGLVPLEGVEIRTYSNAAALLAAESAKTWSSAWEITANSIKLAGEEVSIS